MALVAPAAPAQPAPANAEQPAPPEEPDPYEGRLVREVRVVTPARDDPNALAPLEEPSATLARNQIRTAAGRPYSRRVALEDVGRLNRLGRFANATTLVQLQSDGSVMVTFVVRERPVVRGVEVVGNRRISDQDIAAVIDVLEGTPVDRFQIDRAARAIEDLYRRKGYYLAQVTIDEATLEESSILLFRVREGERIRVTDIRFEGNNAFSPAELRSEVRTKTAHLLERGPLDDDVLEEDVASLVRFYRDRGYLDARAGYQVRPSPDGREAIVIFHVDEGPLYTLRRVDVRFRGGADAPGRFTTEQISGLMVLKPGDVYSIRALEQSLESIRDAYGKLGYPDVRVAPREVRDVQRPLIDLLLIIEEGEDYLVGDVIITGNDITQQKVIRREVQVRPERPLDPADLDETRRRLENVRLFEPASVRVVLQPPDPARPEHRDVLVEVTETNTAELGVGVQYNSDTGPTAFINVRQRNFDIADLPDSPGELFAGRAFRGAGQDFRISVIPGTQLQEYSVSLAEPALFDTDYTGSASLYYRDRDYNEFDELRYGTRFALGRRFGTRWRGGLAARVESIDLSDIDPESPVDYFDVEDQHLLTGLGLSLTRDTTNDRFRPSRGTRFEVAAEQVGLLGGDFDFTRLTAEHTIFLTVHESFLGYKTVFSFSTRLGYIPQDAGEVPVYERFRLGGRTMRGLAYRTVSPKGIRNDTGERGDDPVGGTWQIAFTPELVIPVWRDNVGIAIFSDMGTVTNEPGFDDWRVTVGTGLRIHVPGLSPVPLAFDFAIPLLKEDEDDRRLFTFSIDLPF